MVEQQMSEQESLSIIQQMIQAAKNEQRDNGKGWISWGWLLFLASILTYVNQQYDWFNTFFFWNLFSLATMILLAYEIIKNRFAKKKYRVKTYTNDLFKKLNGGFFICLMLIIFSMNIGAPDYNVPPVKGFALLLVLYGFWILIYGAVLNFKPSIIGAYITWAFAIASLFVDRFDWTMLLHATAVLCGYIIPGHIAYKEFNNVNH